MALTIPYSHFTGVLNFINQEQYTDYELAVESNKHLRVYLKYLKGIRNGSASRFKLDLDRFENDIDKGLYFESNIPQGYGIGSSGALVAAVYDEYVLEGVKNRMILTGNEISNLKEAFSKMESYFHETSSGIDPLLCYIRHPLLIRNKLQIETVSIPREKFGANSAIFLVDSGIYGKTGPLVKMFMERCKNDDFLTEVRNVFIPSNMKPIWESGLQRNDFKMKLCGSGGGGFLLGISRDFNLTRKYFQQKGLELIPVFKND